LRRRLNLLSYIAFFFQAEDGIRDATVTGVQTCALPICGDLHLRARSGAQPDRSRVDAGGVSRLPAVAEGPLTAVGRQACASNAKIGRASCRERVWRAREGVAVKRKDGTSAEYAVDEADR